MHSKTEWQLIEDFHLQRLGRSEMEEIQNRLIHKKRFAIRFQTFSNLFRVIKLYRRKQVKGQLDLLFETMLKDATKCDFQSKIRHLQKLQP